MDFKRSFLIFFPLTPCISRNGPCSVEELSSDYNEKDTTAKKVVTV